MRKYLLLIPFILSADVTLCYKQDFNDLSKIESVKLDGGKCDSKKSVKDMKKDGWSIKDIQISKKGDSFSYTYIFEKKNIKNIDIKKVVKSITIEDEKKKKLIQLKKDIKNGKAYYQKYCQECHGKMGELEPYGNSRKLNKLSLDEFKDAIRAYEYGEKDNGSAILMQGYSPVNSDIENIYKYLKEINK